MIVFDDLGNIYSYDEDDEFDEPHSYNCICETCAQNHPERITEFGDDEDYALWYGDDEELDS